MFRTGTQLEDVLENAKYRRAQRPIKRAITATQHQREKPTSAKETENNRKPPMPRDLHQARESRPCLHQSPKQTTNELDPALKRTGDRKSSERRRSSCCTIVIREEVCGRIR
jgi:hypothetical protein